MTERLDRIEAILLATAERQNEMNASLQQTQAVLNQTAQQQATSTSEIDTLLGAISTNEVGIRALVTKIDESNTRFEILRQEAITDRQKVDRRFEESTRRFDAQQENIQTLLAQLIATNQDISQAKGNISGLSNRIDDLEERAS